VLTSRDGAKGERAAGKLAHGGLSVRHRVLDVADPNSVRALKQALDAERAAVDVLINNAAVLLDDGKSIIDVDPDVFPATLRTNVYGSLILCQAFIPAMVRRGYGRVVNVSSGAGQLSSMNDYAPAYSASKAALNALTRMFAAAVRGANVLVNSADPGWVRTDMGGPRAPRSLAQGADTIVWLATLPDGGPTGGFYHDRKPVPW